MLAPIRRTGRSLRAQEQHRTTAYRMGESQGKHFSRVVDHGVNFVNLIDFGLSMWSEQSNNEPDPDDLDLEFSRRNLSELEKLYNRAKPSNSKTLKDELRNPETGAEFRANYCAGLSDGHGQGRSDDINELRKHLPRFDIFGGTIKSFGWSHSVCMRLLETPGLFAEGDIETTSNNLKLGIMDASHFEFFAGLYLGHVMPTDQARPFQGFMRSELFVACLQIIFTGASSAFGGPGAGIRSKSARNGMTALTIECLAYTAMLLRFTLRKPGKWYHVLNSETDNRFNYAEFYDCLIEFLGFSHFESDVRDLLDYLNRAVFPHTHRRQGRQANQRNGRFSMMQIAVDAQIACASRETDTSNANASNPEPNPSNITGDTNNPTDDNANLPGEEATTGSD